MITPQKNGPPVRNTQHSIYLSLHNLFLLKPEGSRRNKNAFKNKNICYETTTRKEVILKMMRFLKIGSQKWVMKILILDANDGPQTPTT